MSRIIGAISALCLVCLVATASTPPNLDRALEVQLTLARESPGDAKIQNDLGNLLVLDGRLEEAESAYLRALELDETKISARFNLALLLQHQGKTIGALRQFRNVVDRQPENAWAHYQAGILYHDLGLEGRALKSYTRAFQLDRSLTDPLINPHIVRNSLHSHAMLLAYRNGLSDTAPPRDYEDPFRIAGLLVPESKQDPAPPEVVQQKEPEALSAEALIEVPEISRGADQPPIETLEQAPDASPDVTPDLSPDEGDKKSESGGRVLTAESLEDVGATSQAAPAQGSARGRSNQRGTSRSRGSSSRQKSVPAVRLPDPPGSPSTGGRTGTRSTGQLEIDLVPVRAT